MRLDDYLNQRKVAFRRINHPRVCTANRLAEALHIPGKDIAKTVLLRTGHGYTLAVLPSTHRVDLEHLRAELGENLVALASEDEIERLFPDCERGAMPPFGSLYELPIMMDDSLASGDEEIIFEGQSHEEAICMACADYVAVERPRIGHFACR